MRSGGDFGLQEEGEEAGISSQLERILASRELVEAGDSLVQLQGEEGRFQHPTPRGSK